MPNLRTSSYSAYGKDSARLPVTLTTDFTGTTCAFLAKYSATGSLLWTARIAGSGTATPNRLHSTATDSTGAIYGAGVVALTSGGGSAALLFYNADGTYAGRAELLTRTAVATQAPFLVKYNAGGVFQWCGYLAVVGTPGATQYGYGIAVDPSDGIYMSGIVGGNSNVVTAYNGTGTAFGTTYTSGSGAAGDAFLVKYNTAGTVQWLTRVAVPAPDDYGLGLAADSSGVYMTGQIGSGTATAYNAAGTSGGSVATTSVDGLIVKYTLAGAVSWITRVASTAADIGWGATLDSAGNLYVCGQYGAATMTAYSVGGVAFATTLANAGLGDSFLVKYNSSGTVQWVARQNGTAADTGYEVATDSGNNVYLIGLQGAATFTAYSSSGTAFGTTLTSRGAGDAFLVKYDTSGTVQWITQVAGTALDTGYSVVTDASNNVYALVSTASSSLVVYNSDGSTFTTLSLTTNPATALVQYNASGTAQRATGLNLSTTPYGIARDASTNLIVCGTTSAYTSRNLGPSGTIALTLASTTTDAYLVKYSPNGSPLWAARVTAAAYGVRGIAANSAREIYAAVSGGTNGTMTIYNANGTSFGTVPQDRVAVIKYSSLGAVQWVASFTAVGGAAGGLALDSTGAVYVTAEGAPATGTFTVYNADGTTTVSRSSSSGSKTGKDGLLVKYSASGVAQWISNLNESGTNNGRFLAIAIAPDDSIFVSGYTSFSGVNQLFNGNGTNGFGGSTSFGNFSAFVIKYNTSGTLQWRTGSAQPTSSSPGGYGIACDSSGNSYLSGYGGSSTIAVTIYSVGTGAGLTTFRTLSAPTVGSTDGFVIKYNSSGIGQWVTQIQSTDADSPYGLVVDPVTSSLYCVGRSGTTGGSTATVSFPWVSNSQLYVPALAKNGVVGFLARYSPLTDTFALPRWTFRLDSSNATSPDTVWTVAVDRRGNVYIACEVNTIAGATGIIGDAVVSNYGTTAGTNITVACFSPNGMLRWYQSIRGATTFQRALSIATDLDCNVLVGGDTNAETVNIYAKA